jgi:hypothetical protein
MSEATKPRAPHFILTAEGEIHGEDTPENREAVRRIHACLNACEGISTEELEKGIIRDMQRVLADVVPVLVERNRRPVRRSMESLVIDTDTISMTPGR